MKKLILIVAAAMMMVAVACGEQAGSKKTETLNGTNVAEENDASTLAYVMFFEMKFNGSVQFLVEEVEKKESGRVPMSADSDTECYLLNEKNTLERVTFDTFVEELQDGRRRNGILAKVTMTDNILRSISEVSANPISDEEEDIDFDVAPPPPSIIVGTWKGVTKPYHVAYLEIYIDGAAGLYLGSDDCDQLYEIYRGGVLPASDSDYPDNISTNNEFDINLWFNLDWYIYESDGGTPVTGVPNSYEGTYTMRHYWEGNKQILHVKTKGNADPLFGKKELKMEWTPKTINGGSMKDIENE
jgi:hypothetical protein